MHLTLTFDVHAKAKAARCAPTHVCYISTFLHGETVYRPFTVCHMLPSGGEKKHKICSECLKYHDFKGVNGLARYLIYTGSSIVPQ